MEDTFVAEKTANLTLLRLIKTGAFRALTEIDKDIFSGASDKALTAEDEEFVYILDLDPETEELVFEITDGEGIPTQFRFCAEEV